MTVTTVEDLPNELWFELLIYFTWSELNSTWLHWNLNRRIQTLARAVQSRVAFTLSPTSLKTHAQYSHYFEYEHPRMAPRITSLVLDDSILASEIVSRWLHHGQCFLPRLRRCTIHVELVGGYVRTNIIQVIRQYASTLRHLVFYCKKFRRHNHVWRQLIMQRISLHTMQLIASEEEAVDDLPDSWKDSTAALQPRVTFCNTVRLRLSILHSCDLLWLLNGNILPHIEHLHITQEKPPNTSYRFGRSLCWSLRAQDAADRPAECPHLRTLELRQVPMNMVMQLESIRHLESFVLVDCSVKDRVELRAFRNRIANGFTRLRRLHFEFCLPVETVLDEVDLDWFHLDHDAVYQHVGDILRLYTSPYLLHRQRHLYNHADERTSTSSVPIDRLRWTLDCDPASVDATLIHLQSVRSLNLFATIHTCSPAVAWCVVLPHLRSLELNFGWNPVRRSAIYEHGVTPTNHRCVMLEQLRRCAPALRCLTMWWHDVQTLLTHSESPWPSVRQLNVRVETGNQNIPSAALVRQLPSKTAFPQLRYLSFGSRRFRLDPPEVLAELILSYLDGLLRVSSNLTILHLNRCCLYFRSPHKSARDRLLALLEKHVAANERQRSPAKIIIDLNEEIIVWL